MVSRARQSSVEGKNVLAANCWLSVGTGVEADELLAKLGDRV